MPDMDEQLHVSNADAGIETADENQNIESNPQVVDSEVNENQPQVTEHSEELPKGVRKRLDKLTARLYHQEEYVKELEHRLAVPKDEPKLEDMSAEEQVRYLARQEAQKMREYDRYVAAEHRAQETLADAWELKMAEAEKANPVIREIIAEADMPLGTNGPAILKAIMQSDVGPQIALELAKNENLVRQLAQADTTDRKIMLAKLEAKIEARMELSGNPVAPASESKSNRPSANPMPTSRNKGAATKHPDDMDFNEYKKWRAAGNG